MIARNLTLNHSSNRGALLLPVVTVSYVPKEVSERIDELTSHEFAGERKAVVRRCPQFDRLCASGAEKAGLQKLKLPIEYPSLTPVSSMLVPAFR